MILTLYEGQRYPRVAIGRQKPVKTVTLSINEPDTDNIDVLASLRVYFLHSVLRMVVLNHFELKQHFGTQKRQTLDAN